MENSFEFWSRWANHSLETAIKWEERYLNLEKGGYCYKFAYEAFEYYLNDAVETEKTALKYKK